MGHVGTRTVPVSAGRLNAGQFLQASIAKDGPTGTNSTTLHLDSPGIKGKSSKYAVFGYELS